MTKLDLGSASEKNGGDSGMKKSAISEGDLNIGLPWIFNGSL